MKNFIGCKLVKAEPQEKDGKPGYCVVYRDGYKSWSPKDEFERAYLEVQDNPNLASGVSIGPDMVKAFIKDYKVVEPDDKTTIVHATLVNGFTITESSSCVDPSNYSQKIGIEICLKRIENKVWELLGFLLQTAFAGVKADD